MAHCPDIPTLQRFASGELAGPDESALEAHLRDCQRCATALARMPEPDDLLERIREVEQSRDEIAAALTQLAGTEERLTTTIFGRS